MKITQELLRLWGACYTDEKIASFVPEDGLAPLEIAALDIPEEDRLWVLLREELIPARELRLLACGWAESACRKAGWDDARSLNAIAVARRFAVGDATEAELAESEAWSCDVAWAAARSAWSSAAWSWASAARSAWSSTASSAASAAESAARSAWSSTASSWASAAARAHTLADVVRSAQLADVVQVIERLNEAAQAGKEAKE